MAETITDEIARMVSCSMQAFGLGCLNFFFERARFQFWTDSRIFGFVCFGELGIYMYRDEEARLVPFHTDNNLESSPALLRRSMSCRAGFCCTPTSST